MPKRKFGEMVAYNPTKFSYKVARLRKKARMERAPQRSFKSLPTGKQERKVIDTASASYDINTTGSVTLLNGVAAGTDFTDRIGRKIIMKTAQIEGCINQTGGDVATTVNYCRVMIVYDKQSNGALPAITDVLTAATSKSFMNLNNRDRFVVLLDRRHAVGSRGITATQSFSDGPGPVPLHEYIKINLPVIYDGGTAAIGDIQTGSLFLLTIGDVAAGTSDAQFIGALRVRFADA